MNEEQIKEEKIRQIIREELETFLGFNKYTFQKNIQIFDGRNIQLGRTTGTKIGTAIDQKLGFFGTTPVDKPETIEDATDLETVIIVANTIIDRLQELGLIK